MILPQTNARLRGVGRGGRTEDFDVSATDDPSILGCDYDAYVSEAARLVPGPTTLDRISAGYVIVSADVPVTFQAGDTLTLLLDGDAAAITRTVRDVRRVTLPGEPSTIKLYTEPL